jgi:hypothetical protein
MLTESIDVVASDKLALAEAELFIKRLFVQGDYKHYADKIKINHDDLKRILYEVSVTLIKNKISCIVALILKTAEEEHEVIVCRIGGGTSYKINTREANHLTEEKPPENNNGTTAKSGDLVKPQLFTGKLKKDDTLLLCSENLTMALEVKVIQQIITSSKAPEEMCKKLLHSASQKKRNETFSVSIYNGNVKKKYPVKVRMSNKNILLILLLPLLAAAGLLTYYITSGSKDKHLERAPVNIIQPANPNTNKNDDSSARLSGTKEKDIIQAPVIKNRNEIVKPPINKVKEKEKVAAPETIAPKNKNIAFLVNGTIVLISNWESVSQGIKYVSWEKGASDKKSIHKYSGYNKIPSSIRVTFKDNSTRSYKIK